METRRSFIHKLVNLDIGLTVVLAGLSAMMAINFRFSNYLVTREEGDTIKSRISAIEVGMDKINDNVKEMRKEAEIQLKEFRTENKQEMKAMQDLILARQSEVTQRMIDRQDKYYEDLRDRIEGTPARRRTPARSER